MKKPWKTTILDDYIVLEDDVQRIVVSGIDDLDTTIKELIHGSSMTVAELERVLQQNLDGIDHIEWHELARKRMWAEQADNSEIIYPANVSPPAMAEKLLVFFLDKKSREAMLGDLEEEYQTIIVPRLGDKVASLWYWYQVFRSIGPTILAAVLRLASWATRLGGGG